MARKNITAARRRANQKPISLEEKLIGEGMHPSFARSFAEKQAKADAEAARREKEDADKVKSALIVIKNRQSAPGEIQSAAAVMDKLRYFEEGLRPLLNVIADKSRNLEARKKAVFGLVPLAVGMYKDGSPHHQRELNRVSRTFNFAVKNTPELEDTLTDAAEQINDAITAHRNRWQLFEEPKNAT